MKEREQEVLEELERGLRGLVVADQVGEPIAKWATPLFVELDELRAEPPPATPATPGLVAPGSGLANYFTTTPKRRLVLEWTLRECERVQALPKRVDPAIYWAVAAPGVTLTADELKKKSWCGGYCLCSVKSAGFGKSTRWDFFGTGMGASIIATTDPQPGDIAYFDQPNQHYAIIEAASADMLWLVNGNSLGKGIARNVVKRSSVSRCYSIERMLSDPA